MRKLVGVLGGLGPQATITFLELVMAHTQALTDQEHLDLLISQASTTPDRTQALLGLGPSPVPRMISEAQRLEKGGAQFLVVPCNTARGFMEQVIQAVNIALLDIVEVTVDRLRRDFPQTGRIGILGTSGTIAGGLYQMPLEKAGYQVTLPSPAIQQRLTTLIYDGVKAGASPGGDALEREIEQMRQLGAQACIIACTELSVLYHQLSVSPVDVLDSLATLARATVRQAGGAVRAATGSQGALEI